MSSVTNNTVFNLWFHLFFFFFRKAGAGSLFRCKSSQISSGAFTHGLLLWRWKYVQIRGHTFSWTLIQQPAAACLIYFSYVPFSKPVSALVRWKETLPFEHDERRSEGAFVLIRTLLGGKHVSSLDAWPLALCGQDGVYERSERMEARRWASPTVKAAGTPSEYWMIRALGKPHYTFRGILFSPLSGQLDS